MSTKLSVLYLAVLFVFTLNCHYAFLLLTVWFEPTDIHKASKPLLMDCFKQITYTSPNLHELKSMYKAMFPHSTLANETKEDFTSILYQTEALSKDIIDKYPSLTLVATLGQHGVMVSRSDNLPVHYSANFRPVSVVSGAGDCLAAGMIDSLMDGATLGDSVDLGLQCANISLDHPCAVPFQIRDQIKDFGLTSSSVNELFNSP